MTDEQNITKEQIEIIVKIHKKMMETIGENLINDEEGNFKISSMSIALTISAVMTTLGLKNTNPFLDSLIDYVRNKHDILKSNTHCYMVYKDGNKKTEGLIN